MDAQAHYATADHGYRTYIFDEPLTLAAGETYYVAVRADRSGSFTQLAPCSLLVDTTAKRASPFGEDASLATRTWTGGPPGTPGAWTISDGECLLAAFIIDEVDDGINPPTPPFEDDVPVPFPGVSLQPNVLEHNLLATDGATFSGTGWDEEEANINALINQFANSAWAADSPTSSIVIELPHLVSANAFGIAKHNLGGHGITVEYSEDAGANWLPAGSFSPPNQHVLFGFLTGVYTASHWRISVSGGTVPEITHIKLGIAVAFERRVYAGVVPGKLNREAKTIIGAGSGGQHVGDRVIRERISQALEVKNLTGDWVRFFGKPLLENMRDSSVFVAWRPGKYPFDVVYGWATGDVKSSHTGPARYMDYSLDVEGIDSWLN
jgi:hypothetical protein